MVESFIFFNYNELSILYTGFKLFILSELLIFLSLFASYFNYMLLSVSMSSLSLFVIFFSIPFSNLLILLYSSFSVQSSLIFIKFGYFYNVIEGISQTISIGILFLVLQFKEFLFSIYSYSSSFLGSLLYFTTGLHGLHVIIGLLFLLFSFFVLFLSSISFISFIHVPVLLPLYLSHLSYCSSTSYYFFNHSYLHISSLSYLSYNSSISYYFFLPHVSLLFTSSNIKYFWLSCFLIIYSCLLFYCLTITSNISYLLFLVVSVLFVVIYGCLFLGVYIPQVIYL